MAVSYSIHGDVLTMRMVGSYEAVEVPNVFRAALADPGCPVPVGLLVDVSQSTSLPGRSAADIRMISEALGPHAGRIGGRCAVVAPSDVQFGLSQMGAVHSANVGVTVRVFRTTEQALEWLVSPSA